MGCLFGNNSCTWVLILVIVYLLTQQCNNDDARSACGCNGYGGCGCGCG